MGGYAALDCDPAWWRAGQTNAFCVTLVVNLMAWSMLPFSTSP